MWIDSSMIENREATAFDLASGLEVIDKECRKGLEVDHKDYDALDIVTLNNHGKRESASTNTRFAQP